MNVQPRIRMIPVLLIDDQSLYKTQKFTDPKYVGDPMNALTIFNEKEVDELVFLDIVASKENKEPDFDFIEVLAGECFMPVSYGGGITSIEHVRRIIALGVEKVVINHRLIQHPEFITELADSFGSQSIVASIDIKKNLWGSYKVYDHTTKKTTSLNPIDFAKQLESLGAGEIFLNVVDRDGMQQGYDLDIIKKVSDSLSIPLICCGGAGSIEDLAAAINTGGASAVSAGSFFVFHGKHRAVLITYPDYNEFSVLLD